MQLYADSGTEKFIPFARCKLAQWKEVALRSGLVSFAKTIFADEGTTIYVNSLALGHGQYRDRIRIVGGNTWWDADPVWPIWRYAEALLPSTTSSWVAAATAHTINHISVELVSPSGVYVRTLGGVPYTVKYQNKTVRHTLVINRYCKRVATFSWDEVWTFDQGYIPDVTPFDAATYNVSDMWLEGVSSIDDDYVYLVNQASDFAQTKSNPPHALAHGLGAAALGNPWGMVSDLPDSSGNMPWAPVGRAKYYDQYYVGFIAETSGPNGTGSIVDYIRVEQHWPRSYDAGTYDPVHGGMTETFLPSGGGGPIDTIAGIVSVADAEAFDVVAQLAWAYSHGGLAYVSPIIASGTVGYPEQQADNAAYAAALVTHLNKVVLYVQTIAAMMTAKLTTDASEIQPLSSLPYASQRAAYIIPVETTTTYKATCINAVDSAASPTATLVLTSTFDIIGILGASVFGVTFEIPDTSPIPPRSAVFLPVVKYKFAPATAAFELQISAMGTQWLPYVKPYFTSGASFGSLTAATVSHLSYGGMYSVVKGVAATAHFAAGLGVSDTVILPDGRMAGMCVGAPALSLADVTYVAYNAAFTKCGAAYRQTAHSYANGTYTAVQLAIPNTDVP